LVFDIPIELFILGNALSLVFVILAFLPKEKIHIIILTGGLFVAIFALATDNIIMGYNYRDVDIVNQLDNSTAIQTFGDTVCTEVLAITTCVVEPSTTLTYYNNTLIKVDTAYTPITYEFTELVKTLFVLIGIFICMASVIMIIRPENN